MGWLHTIPSLFWEFPLVVEQLIDIQPMDHATLHNFTNGRRTVLPPNWADI